MNSKKIIKYLIITQWLLFSGVIFYFSSQSRIEFLPSSIWNYDKVVHFSVFFLYGISTYFLAYILFSKKYLLTKVIILGILIAALFAGSDEIHQMFTPNRNSDFYDFLADFTGILTSIFIFKVILKKVINKIK